MISPTRVLAAEALQCKIQARLTPLVKECQGLFLEHAPSLWGQWQEGLLGSWEALMKLEDAMLQDPEEYQEVSLSELEEVTQVSAPMVSQARTRAIPPPLPAHFPPCDPFNEQGIPPCDSCLEPDPSSWKPI